MAFISEDTKILMFLPAMSGSRRAMLAALAKRVERLDITATPTRRHNTTLPLMLHPANRRPT